MIDVHYASLTSQGVQHRRSFQMVTHPDINPVQQGLTSVNRREPVFPFGASRTTHGGKEGKCREKWTLIFCLSEEKSMHLWFECGD